MAVFNLFENFWPKRSRPSNKEETEAWRAHSADESTKSLLRKLLKRGPASYQQLKQKSGIKDRDHLVQLLRDVHAQRRVEPSNKDGEREVWHL